MAEYVRRLPAIRVPDLGGKTMQHIVSEIIVHISNSQQHMARVLDAKRQVAVRMAQIIHALPDVHPEFEGISGLKEQSATVSKNIVAYLNGLAELEEAMAEQLQHIMKELNDDSEE